MQELHHNIVSILYSLKGMIETHLALAEEGRGKTGEEVLLHAEEVLRRAYRQVDRALQITKRLGLVLHREERARGELEPARVREVWREVLKLLAREFDLEGFEILARIPEDFPEIQCEREALIEILYHLAKNALQAMGSMGKLIIRTQLAFSMKEEPYGIITLADTGPGIGEERLPFLFQPFFTTKGEEEGNGLGLYFTKALTMRNGGRISASSFQGYGTTFTLEFPVALKTSPAKAAEP